MQKSSGKTWMFLEDVLQPANSQWLKSFGDGFRNSLSVPCTCISSSSAHSHPRLQFHTAALRVPKPSPWCAPCTSQSPTPFIPCSCHPSASQTLLQSRSHHTQRGRKGREQDHKPAQYNKTLTCKGFLGDLNENSCYCPIPGSVQCQGAESTEQSGLVEAVPAHGRGLKLDDL